MKTTMFQIWIRMRGSRCSHMETIYLRAENIDDAFNRSEKLFGGTHKIKAAIENPSEWIEQESCGCGNSITVETGE